MLSGPASIELVPENLDALVLGAKFAKITLPIGKNTLTFMSTRETAAAIQKVLSFEIVEYAE